MADLAASDVTVTLIKRGRVPGLANVGLVTIAFGNSSKTVPAAGVPLPAELAKFGGRQQILGMDIWGTPNDGLVYQYDLTNHKMLVKQVLAVAAHTHDIKLIGGITATEPVAVQGGDTLGKNAATDRTIAGADSATKGGVVSGGAAAAAPLAAYTGAIAPTSIKALVFVV